MNKRELDNKTLDAIGKKLVYSGRLPASDIDKVVSNPRLFSLINQRIASPANRRPSLFLFIRQQRVAFAGAAILLIVVLGVASLLRPARTLDTTRELRVPAARPERQAPPVFPPKETETGKLSAGGAPIDNDIRVERAIARPPVRKYRPQPQPEIEGEFLPVAYTSETLDTSGGGHIIRVDLKRSSLFALGVNLPLENNDDEMVQADLLIGKDGVTRGVRVVN